MQNYRLNDRTAVLLILFFACASIIPMALLGIPDGFDLLQHVRFANAYLTSWSVGDLVPVWGGNDNSGFGSIGIRFYPPLSYLVLSIAREIFGNWYDAFWTAMLFWLAAGCIGIYFWGREWLTPPYALFASLLYCVAPYHTFQIYQAVLYAESAVAGILPFCFLFLTRLCRRQQTLDAILFSISLTLLLLCHIPSTVIGLSCLFLYGAFLTERQHFGATAIKAGSAFAGALLASAFHWVKVVSEIGWVMHNKPEFYSSGYYDFHRYFFPLYLINPLNRYIEKMLWELDLIIIISMIFFVPSSIFLVTRLRRIFTPRAIYRPHIGLLVGGVFSLFMLSSVSSFLWDWLPVLPKIQFPWRWLIVATAFGPVCLVVLLSDLAKFANRRVLVYAAAAFTMILILYSVTQNILQSNPLSREVFTRQVSEMDSTEACSCWWPVWATSAAKDQHEQVASGARPVTIEKWSAADRSFSVDGGKPSNATVATFWYPYWQATVNGSPVNVEANSSGAITLPLPAEKSDVHLYFLEPFFVRAAGYLSLITWIGIIATLLSIWRNGRLTAKLAVVN